MCVCVCVASVLLMPEATTACGEEGRKETGTDGVEEEKEDEDKRVCV